MGYQPRPATTNLHSPGPIGDVTPGTVGATVLTAGATTITGTITATGAIEAAGQVKGGNSFLNYAATGVNYFRGITHFDPSAISDGACIVPSAGLLKVRRADDSGDAPITALNVIATSTVRLAGFTVATLPAGTIGDNAYVTDAIAPTFLATVVGGGAITTPVFYNGSNWVST